MISKKTYYFSLIIIILLFSGSILLIETKKDNNFDQDSTQVNSQNLNIKNQTVDDINSSRENILTKTVREVSPAVVGINVTEIRQYRDPFSSFFDDPFFRQFFGNQGTYNQKIKELGSGYIISSDGYIVTNDHVAGNAAEIKVTLTDGRSYDAKIVGSDTPSDVCLLKIDAANLPYLKLGNSDDIIIGEWVIALGNPFGLFEINDKPTVTVGVISATGMNLEPVNGRYYLNMIQTDAAINGGNSGGPLVNSLGEVIGMNTLIFTAGNSNGNIGLGFALPINKVKRIIKELKEDGKIDRDFEIGLRIQTIDEGLANYYKLKTTKGVIVTKVYPGTPANEAGIEVGDIITKIDGYQISNEGTMQSVFFEFRVGQTIKIDLIRDNKNIVKEMKLEKKG